MIIIIVKSFILGFIQGVSEFLPISSSGHLIWLQNFVQTNDIFLFTITVHFGTWLSLLLFYRKTITYTLKTVFYPLKENILYKLIIASLPVFIVGALFYSLIKSFFVELHWSAFGFILTALFLFGTFFLKKRHSISYLDIPFSDQIRSLKEISFTQLLMIGLAQSFALLPGASRSGWTIATGLYFGLHPATALTFSFLMGFIALLAASIVEFSTTTWSQVQLAPLIIGFFVSFIVGYIALYFMRKWVFNLYMFSFYLFPLGSLCLIYLFYLK